MSLSEKKQGIFYGWILVACGVLVMAMTHGVVINCFSLFIIPVTDSLQVSRESFSLCLSIVNAIYAVISLTSGAIYRRLKVHTLMKLSAILLPAAYIGYGFCRSLPAFYACAVLAGVSISFLTFLPWTQIICNWFVEKQGTALGICFMGTGLGGMVFNMLTALLLEHFGVRTAFVAIGVAMLVVLVPVIFLVVRIHPAEMGMQPLGVKSDAASEERQVYGPMLKDAVRTVSFWALLAVALIIGLDSIVAGNIIAPHLCDLGYDTLYASGVVSAYMAALALMKILHGRLYDWIGAIKGTVVSLCGFVVGFLGLYFAGMQWTHALILIIALGTSSSNVSYPITTRYAFGTRDYTSIYGIMMGMNFVTCSVGVVLANSVYSAAGTYDPMILVCSGMGVLAIALLPFIKQCVPKH